MTNFTVIKSVSDPSDAFSTVSFSRLLGTFTYDNYPNADVLEPYLNPPLSGLAADDGKYLIRVDQVSGTALTGTLSTWVDINSLATHTWSLDQSVVGVLGAVANIAIAPDNGSGSPVAANRITRTVTFSSEVRTASDVVWTEDPYALVEMTENKDATCILTFNPDGFTVGDADTSGSFQEKWHVDSPYVGIALLVDRFLAFLVDRFGEFIEPRNPEATLQGFTVNATLVSGVAPTGSTLGADLTLEQVREWTLTAEDGEDFNCALDVTVSDGTTPITKRITMNSLRAAA